MQLQTVWEYYPVFPSITLAMGYVPLAKGICTLSNGIWCTVCWHKNMHAAIHWLTNMCTGWRLAWPGNKVQCARGGCCPSLINSMLWLHAATVVEGVLRYLGLGMINQAGICTIVISMNRTFKRCPICRRLNSAQSHGNLCHKKVTNIKNHIIWKCSSC